MGFFPDKAYIKSVLTLAYPVVVGMMARTVMGLVDVIMVGRLGVAQLAAVGLGFHFVILIVYSFSNFNVGVQALASRRYGERNFLQCGDVVQRTVLFIWTIGLAGSIAGFFYGPVIFSWFTDDPEVYRYGSTYVSIRLLEMFAVAIMGVHRGFFDGIGKTTVYMKTMLIMNGLNIALNYMLIFGKFGIPQLGVTGAALGSMISSYVGAAVIFWFAFRPEIRDKFKLYTNMRVDLKLVGKLYRLSVPVMFQTFMLFAGFLTFLKITGMISTVSLAASNACMNIISVSFMPGFGIGIAAATFVGQNLGAGKPDMAEKMAVEAIKFGVVFMGALGVLFLAVPGLILRMFTPDQAIIDDGIMPLRIVGVVQFIDAVGLILANILRGAGMTTYVMVVDILVIWALFVPAAYLFGITLNYGNSGAWFALALYIVAFAGTLWIAFKKGNWKNVVI